MRHFTRRLLQIAVHWLLAIVLLWQVVAIPIVSAASPVVEANNGPLPGQPDTPVNVIEVNTQNDELNSDGDCSLREAVQAANTNTAIDSCAAGGADDLIMLPVGTYTLSIGSNSEDNNQAGDLDISGDLTVVGLNRETTIIQGGTTANNGIDRVFHILNNTTTLTIQELTIRYGRTKSGSAPHINGGGIFVSTGVLNVKNSTFHDNSAANGGAIASNLGDINITDSLFYDNDGGSGGGGILSLGTTNITRTTFHHNTGEFGGALSRWIGTINVYDTVFYNNSATFGGVANGGATLNIYNSTLSGNTATDSGGAIRNFGESLFIYNTTIVDNISANGGGIWTSSGEVSLTDTIVANNAGADCFSAAGTFVSHNHNLDSDNSCSLTQPNDLPNTDPMLDTLADNGGPTWTHALLPLSPGINRGSCSGGTITTDQRGVTRPQGMDCDIGAYEYDGDPFVFAVDDEYTTLEDTILELIPPGILTNDLSFNSISATLLMSPTNGVLSLNPNGSLIYTADENFNGLDSFSYMASDGTLTDTAVVTITILSAPDSPIAVNDTYTTSQNTTLVVPEPGLLSNDTDPDGDILTVVDHTAPMSGTVTVNGDGSFVYTPDLNFYGTDSFTYSVSDGILLSQATVTITILPSTSIYLIYLPLVRQP